MTSQVEKNSVRNKDDLKEGWNELRDNQPGIRPRRAARELGVTELELISALSDGKQVVRLDADPKDLIHRSEDFGYSMALTRNESVISQTEGYYQDIDFDTHAGNVLGDKIDLRLFPDSWVESFAVSGELSKSGHPSVQFFHKSGQAAHKIYLLEDGKKSEYESVIDDYRHPEQSAQVTIESAADTDSGDDSTDVDEEAFLEDWGELDDVHDFFGLLRDYGLSRTRALEIARGEFTEPVPVDSVLEMLESASRAEIPIMVFTRGPGCIQIYSGPVENVSDSEEWYNVLDDDFDLHVNHPTLSEVWVVEKPVKTGKVTSIEAFDEEGDQTVSFFGVRKSGEKEDAEWRELTEQIRERSFNHE